MSLKLEESAQAPCTCHAVARPTSLFDGNHEDTTSLKGP
jgi:hypothetical protein